MKKIFYIGLISFAFLSCGKDDCSADGFLGTWKGTKNCTTKGESQVTVRFYSSGSNYYLEGDSFYRKEVNINDCSFEGGFNFIVLGVKVNGTLSKDGKSLTFKSETGSSTSLFTCTYVLNK
jgi:hypothetical protein